MNKGKSIGENAENCQGSKKPQKHFIEFSLCCLSFLILETEWHAKNFLQLSDEIDRIFLYEKGISYWQLESRVRKNDV
jgi:hypothetical protein